MKTRTVILKDFTKGNFKAVACGSHSKYLYAITAAIEVVKISIASNRVVSSTKFPQVYPNLQSDLISSSSILGFETDYVESSQQSVDVWKFRR